MKCPFCGSLGFPKRKRKGKLWVFVFLLIFLFPVGILYGLKNDGHEWFCMNCKMRRA